ncbi:uncharacterized protein METZ01_LOCUS235433 [marine metagenome]|uniref:Uncharacterized protein n=1 Tax=marine metagenome TaxID=408172 RepID=A0A382H5X4_9ZZZZ
MKRLLAIGVFLLMLVCFHVYAETLSGVSLNGLEWTYDGGFC